MPSAKYRHHACRIMDDLVYKGHRTIFLENELIRVGVLLDKGADIFQFQYKPTDTDFLWRSSQGLIRPDRFTTTRASSAGSFLDFYHGGCGPVDYAGAELGLHGEVTHLGWECDILEDCPERISIRLSVNCIRTPLHLERTMTLEQGAPHLLIEETLENLSPEQIDFMWGHHPAFGAPFLQDGVRLFIPAGKGKAHDPKFTASSVLEPGMEFDWPIAPAIDGSSVDLSTTKGPDGGFAELIYLSELREAWYALLNPKTGVGFGLAWDKKVMPYLWFWLVYGRAPGYPWWDNAYVIALEPWTSIPNNLNIALESGTQAILKGGEKITFSCTATAFAGLKEVKRIGINGEVE
jgi:galactose mutarotase-like enzyme